MTESLYFLAILPPDDLAEKITLLKKEAALKYKSRHALKSPPHITLIAPFWFEEAKIHQLYTDLGDFVDTMPPFNLVLNGFGSFRPRVIFIKVEESGMLNMVQRDLREKLQSTWKIRGGRYDKYHPHLTIAFKDLSRTHFYRAWDDFKDRRFKAAFTAGELILLKHFDRRWHIDHRMTFNGSGLVKDAGSGS